MRLKDSRRGTIVALLLLVCLSAAGGGPRGAGQSNPSRYEKAAAASRVAVREMMDKHGVPGVGVAVVVGDDVVWSEGFGFADLEQQVPVTRETKFGIGSITKAMTTALCARLMEKGLLDLDAPVESYLAEFPHKNQKISVRLIAGHLSGLDDTFNTAQTYTQTHYNTTAEALRQILKEPLKHRPLERHFYTTGPYTIIAGVVEKAAGGDFLALMNQHVVGPLGLKNTTPNDRQAIIPHRTSFYVRENDKTVNAPYFDPSFKWAGAGYLSTAEEMARFGSAHLKPGFLKQSTVDELFRPMRTAAGEDTGFGLGWRLGKDARGRSVVYQPGGGPGISSVIILYPKENLAVAILSNLRGAPVGGEAADAIADAFLLK